ncbi:MAG: winged helix-turn-helix domain-containing protein, partial [Christensenellaceae bacterium]
MTSPIPVTRGEARRFMLWYQGLLGPRKGDVMNWVGRLGAVQFDPLNPFMRSAELTLAARVEAFTPDKLAHELYD